MRLPVFLLSLLATALCSADEIFVYLLGGQSNMQGSGQLQDVAAEVPEEFERCFSWEKGQLVPFSPEKRFGPEVGMALSLKPQEKPAAFIKFSRGGMPLHPGWNGNKWVGEPFAPQRVNFFPGLTATDPNKGTLYLGMLECFRKGLAALRADGLDPVVVGFFWMQGEQDSKVHDSATSYAANLALLRARLKDDLSLDKKKPLPLIFGQVLPHEPALERFIHRKEIRAQMAATDQDSGQPEAIPKARMVSTDGYPLLKDTVHYSAEGQLRLGKAFIDALRGL